MNLSDQSRAPIFEALERYKSMRIVPFDVPGHKRGKGNPELTKFLGEKCLTVDVNSMKPLDNLCHPVSVIKEAEELAARAFGAQHAFFMVNGTTSAVQSMIMSVCKRGDKIIMPRNVHRSAINALIISGAVPVYVNPSINKQLGIPLGMSVADVKKAIEQKPDAILFSPSSMDASDELLKEAKEKGIRITYIDSYTKEELQDLTVATDNVNAGRMLGEYARKLIDKDSKIAIVSHVKGVSTAVEREQGFREGLGDYADNIVDIVYCNSLYEKSYELAQELMRKYPDLELIAGMNEYSAVGVGRAVSDAGAKDKIAVVGVDCSQEAINLMEMGVYKGIIVQKAFRMGYIGVEETIHMLNGDAVEKNIDSGCELVTPENMYNSDIERLIFPFS